MTSIGLHRKAKTALKSTKAVYGEKCIPSGEKTAYVIVCHYVCHYGNNACHYGNTVSVRKHCHHRNRNTVCHYGNTVCHYGNNVCMSFREHNVYVITGTPCVCHHGNTVCKSSREHRVYVIMGIPSVSHHGNTVCRSSREHRVYVITGKLYMFLPVYSH